MEQRNGRIERQGNENSEVDIFRYVTDKSFDAYLYQILENKQRFISQVMTSKTPERVCSDVDEQALDYAEVMAPSNFNKSYTAPSDVGNALADIDGDGMINNLDYALILDPAHFNKTTSACTVTY